MNQTQMGTNEAVVVMSAVRYMLGRSSYGVGSVCDFIKENKNRLSNSNKEVIVRDIQEYFDKYQNASYKNDWFEIIDILI